MNTERIDTISSNATDFQEDVTHRPWSDFEVRNDHPSICARQGLSTQSDHDPDWSESS